MLSESELIINSQGAVYHLGLMPEELASTVITVGDPDRVKIISRYFDSIEIEHQNREFVSCTGRVGQKRITVLSTGIGTGNIDIVLNELDALKNIDLSNRTIRPQHTALTIIRLGPAGSLQPDIPVDSFVAATHGLGLDNLLHFYLMQHNEEELQLLQQFVTHTQLNGNIQPYITSASFAVLKHFVDGFYQGITLTCPGFYGPQGRVLRLGLSHPAMVGNLSAFRMGNHRICNFEMETSAIYGLSRLLGHQCISLSCIVANRVRQTFSSDVSFAIEHLIEKALGIIEQM